MLKASLRSVLAHKIRLTLSAVAVLLGVAFVAGTLIFTDTLRATFDNLFGQVTPDVTVSKKAAFQALDGRESDAGLVPASLVPKLQAVPGVRRVVGSVTVQGVRVIGRDGKVVGTQGGAPGLGVDWSPPDAQSPVHLVQGRP